MRAQHRVAQTFSQPLTYLHNGEAEMIVRFDETGASQIMVEPVEDVTAYGVVDCKGESLRISIASVS
jgi:UTP-glucose-1-phosphate uridylyltransferase